MLTKKSPWLANREVWGIVSLAVAAAAGLVAVFARSYLGQFWVLLLAVPAAVVVLPLAVRRPERWLFSLLVLCLPFSARFRFGAAEFHLGGAEAAVAMIDFPLLALFLLYLLEDLKNRRLLFYNGAVERRLLLFALVGAFSMFTAVAPSFTMLEIARLLKMLALIYCIKRFVRSRQEVDLVFYLLVLNVVIQSLLGLAQLALGRSLGLFFLGEADALWIDAAVEGTVSRVGGTLGHANALAQFLEMLLPILLSLLMARKVPSRKRLLSLAAFLPGLLALLFTFSRSAWGAMLAATFLVVVYHFRHLRFSVRQIAAIGTGGLASLAALFVFWEPIYRRLTASSSASFSFRQNLIIIATNMIRDHPWIGIGLNNFVLVMARYDTVGLTERRLAPVHNIYYLVAAEVGLVGLLAFFWLLLGIFSEGWQALKSDDAFLSSLTAGILAGLVATLVHSLLGWGWRYDVIHVTFWFLVGYVLSIKRVSFRSQVQKEYLPANP